MRLGHGGNDRVERAARPALRFAIRHQSRPDQRGVLVEGEHAAGEQRLRAFRPGKPGLELDAIAAVVLGGTSLFGGRGGVLGTFFAVMLLQVLRNIFNLLGLGSFYQMTVTGVIIVLAILVNRLIDNRGEGH